MNMQPAVQPFRPWPSNLPPPVDCAETLICYRAQSILTEAGQRGPLLPYNQARDVVRWHESHLQRQCRATLGRRLRNFLSQPLP